MKKYRIIAGNLEGSYYVQQWKPAKWWRKGYWSNIDPLPYYSLEDANNLLDWVLLQDKRGKEREAYLAQPGKVIREEEVK